MREFHYRWVWRLRSTPEQLWPLLTDTNRFNRDTGVPSILRRDPPDQDADNARRNLRLYRLGVPVDWEEEPFEWERPYRFGVVRRYSRGPLRTMRVQAELTPVAEGGTTLVYSVQAQAANVLGLLAIPVQIGLVSARSFAAAAQRYDRLALENNWQDKLRGPVEFAPGGKQRLATLEAALLVESPRPDVVTLLCQTVREGDALALGRMRPYALADLWAVPRSAVLETCLLATRRGLLEFQWEVLCPLCRNPKESASSLGGLHEHVHCEVCHVDFTANFERSVELTFRPNPSIRETGAEQFCVAGPQTTPHVVVQQLVSAGGERSVEPALEAGRYRLRTLGLRGGEFLQVTPDGLPEATLRASSFDGWPDGELNLSQRPRLTLKNATDAEQLFMIERLAWSDNAVIAAEVTTMQSFRDLFSNEALRPGEQIAVGSLTIIFTDLRGSTQLYNEIGDAPAFGLVMDHFDVLREAIRAEGGAIVKTIGDAIMAVFRRPAPALRSMLRAQAVLAGRYNRPLTLRAGIHYGPCIAVTLNERLDYFGSTVNKAARLEHFSTGGDVIISDAVQDDPEVTDLLAAGDLHAEPFSTP